MDAQLEKLAKDLSPYLSSYFLSLRSGWETGTWTPSWGGSTTNGTISYSANEQVGSYIRIGTLVIAFVHFLRANVVTVAPTGNLLVRGLPYTSENTTNKNGTGFLSRYDNINLNAGTIDLAPIVSANSNSILFVESYDNAAGVIVQGAAITNQSRIVGTVIYTITA